VAKERGPKKKHNGQWEKTRPFHEGRENKRAIKKVEKKGSRTMWGKSGVHCGQKCRGFKKKRGAEECSRGVEKSADKKAVS